MSLTARKIAVSGIGYPAIDIATQGLLGGALAVITEWITRARRRGRR
jgi:hypothetical protein